MNTFFRAVLIAIYLLALARWAELLGPGWPDQMVRLALILIVAHAMELTVYQRRVRLYPGSIYMSALLTLLFGLLHWKPLSDAEARRVAAEKQALEKQA